MVLKRLVARVVARKLKRWIDEVALFYVSYVFSKWCSFVEL